MSQIGISEKAAILARRPGVCVWTSSLGDEASLDTLQQGFILFVGFTSM
jgi:hypothetical protein